jgi:ribosomal protein S18 acetylase RimI-like enzyme
LSILLVAVSDEKVLGFVAGSVDRERFWKSFLTNKFRVILWYGILGLRRDFTLIKLGFKRLWTMIFGIPEKSLEGWTIINIPKASLMWILVDEQNRNKGVGCKLNKEFLDILRKKNCDSVKLGVKRNNTHAIRSYLKAGWRIVFTGERSLMWRKQRIHIENN